MGLFHKCPYRKRYVFTCLKWYFREYFHDAPKRAWQRMTKGYCDEDLWGIDSWFMDTMPRMLEDFKKKTHSIPAEFSKEYGDGTDEKGWNEVLSHMISLLKDMEERYTVEDFKAEYERMDKAKEEFFQLFSKWFYNLWD